MAILFLFLFGIANFALHKAVMESHHPLLLQMPWFFEAMGGRLSLMLEFIMLAGAMLLAADGNAAWAWGYAAYSLVNGASAWLILSGRV